MGADFVSRVAPPAPLGGADGFIELAVVILGHGFDWPVEVPARVGLAINLKHQIVMGGLCKVAVLVDHHRQTLVTLTATRLIITIGAVVIVPVVI